MAYALKGSLLQLAVQQRSAAHSTKPTRLTRTVVKANQTPTQAAKEAKAAIGKLAASASAAALLLVRPAVIWRGKPRVGPYTGLAEA